MLVLIKHRLIKIIEKIPLLQVFVYNNLQYFKFLFPHDKDYYALKLLFNKNETRTFLDIGGNIGLSTIGFRELGFLKNRIMMFEPDQYLLDNYVSKVTKNYSNIKVYPFGLSDRSEKKKLFRAFYKNVFFHFNNSFNLNYLKENGFSFCPEITTKISMMNIDIEEFPINYIGRTYEQGKKITAFDGLDALYVLAKYRYFN